MHAYKKDIFSLFVLQKNPLTHVTTLQYVVMLLAVSTLLASCMLPTPKQARKLFGKKKPYMLQARLDFVVANFALDFLIF